MNNNLIKILVVGDSNVGKSNLLLRYAENQFVNEYIKSIGTDFKAVKGQTELGLSYTIQIWDYVSHDHLGPFKSLNNSQSFVYVLFLFDLTNSSSFSNISKWVTRFNNEIKEGDKIIKILVANKLDLHGERSINDNTIKSAFGISESNSFFKNYFEISVKENTNIENLFSYIIMHYESQQQNNNNNNNNLNNNNNNDNNSNSKKKRFLFFKI